MFHATQKPEIVPEHYTVESSGSRGDQSHLRQHVGGRETRCVRKSQVSGETSEPWSRLRQTSTFPFPRTTARLLYYRCYKASGVLLFQTTFPGTTRTPSTLTDGLWDIFGTSCRTNPVCLTNINLRGYCFWETKICCLWWNLNETLFFCENPIIL